jgi:hypothetical protein
MRVGWSPGVGTVGQACLRTPPCGAGGQAGAMHGGPRRGWERSRARWDSGRWCAPARGGRQRGARDACRAPHDRLPATGAGAPGAGAGAGAAARPHARRRALAQVALFAWSPRGNPALAAAMCCVCLAQVRPRAMPRAAPRPRRPASIMPLTSRASRAARLQVAVEANVMGVLLGRFFDVLLARDLDGFRATALQVRPAAARSGAILAPPRLSLGAIHFAARPRPWSSRGPPGREEREGGREYTVGTRVGARLGRGGRLRVRQPAPRGAAPTARRPHAARRGLVPTSERPYISAASAPCSVLPTAAAGTEGGTRRVQLVRKEGRDVSS